MVKQIERWKCILLRATNLMRGDKGRGQLCQDTEDMAGGGPQPASVPEGAERILAQALPGDQLQPGKGTVSELTPTTDFATLSDHSPILFCSCAAPLYQKYENYSYSPICMPGQRLVTVLSHGCKYFFLLVILLHVLRMCNMKHVRFQRNRSLFLNQSI